jgi:rod shape determining protein RodA
MLSVNNIKQRLLSREQSIQYRSVWQCIHIDLPLLLGILLLMSLGLVILYSASNQNINVVEQQLVHTGLALGVMFLFAQIPPSTYQRWALWIYLAGVGLLLTVLVMGHIGKGAQRWLNLGFTRLQPSEVMKIAIPLMLAWYYHRKHLPLSMKTILLSAILILIPALLTAKQPDLGTAILLVVAGFSTLFLAGLSFWLITLMLILVSLGAPLMWFLLHDYQRQRVLTFFSPERDPLGAGYHTIQNCDWLRRIIRQRLAEWNSITFAFFARTFDRFYFCCVR